MKTRRIVVVALRILSLYLGIRELQVAVRTTSLLFRGGGAEEWTYFAAALFPIVAAVVLWFGAEPISTRVIRILPRTEAEIDEELDAEEQDAAPGAGDGTHARGLLVVALTVLGVYLVVFGATILVSNVTQLAFHSSFSCPSPQQIGPGEIPGITSLRARAHSGISGASRQRPRWPSVS